MHIGTSAAEGVPYVIVAAFEVFDTHVAVLVLHNLIPDVHQAFHLIGLSLFHERGIHLEDEVLSLQVQEGTCLEQVLLEKFPVGIGHAAGGIPVTVELTAFNVNLYVGKV